jgi:predicted Zn finger-like uncharacterized protein
VVVVCEKCETRFHLGDSRVPAKGAQVRCSRCKHVFFISSPESGEADVIDEVVAEVTGAGGTSMSEVVRDLLDPDPEGAELELRGNSGSVEFQAEDLSPGDFEEDWQFNDDSPAQIQEEAKPEFSAIGEFDASALDLAGEAPLSEIATDGADPIGEPEPGFFPGEKSPIDPVESIRARDAGLDLSSPDDLGSPEDWDFVGTAEVEAPLEFTPEENASEPLLPRVDESGSASPSPALADSPTTWPPAAEESDRVSLATRFAGVASIAGWVVVALAFSVGMSALFTRPEEGSAVSAGSAGIAVSGLPLTASAVEGRLVENALAGNLLVVSGELESRGPGVVTPGRAVWVQLVSGTGVPIAGATAAAGAAVAETRLREWDPDRLRLDLERSAAEMAHGSFRPGVRVRFDAVFESIPESAAGWVLQAATSPSHPDPWDSPPSTTPPAWE